MSYNIENGDKSYDKDMPVVNHKHISEEVYGWSGHHRKQNK